MNFIAFATKGLEDVVAEELKDLGAEAIAVTDKKVFFTANWNLEQIMEVRTADDIALVIKRTPAKAKKLTLEQLLDLLNPIDFAAARTTLRGFRSLSNTFSLTVNADQSKIKAEGAKAFLSPLLSALYGWEYTATEHENFDIRLVLEDEELIVAVRISKEPLHKRAYKQGTKLGSLKPTIAASLVKLLGAKEPGTLVDTFCGSGTILCEAALQGFTVSGGDIDFSATEIAQQALATIGEDVKIQSESAFATDWPDHSFDYAVSNLPWEQQIKTDSITDMYTKALEEFARIVKPTGSLCFILKKPELFVKFAKVTFPQHEVQTRQISFLGQQPTVVTIKPLLF